MGVGDPQEVRSSLSGQSLCGRIAGAWDQNDLGGGTSSADRGDGGLDGGSPCLEVRDIVGFVHHTELFIRLNHSIAYRTWYSQ